MTYWTIHVSSNTLSNTNLSGGNRSNYTWPKSLNSCNSLSPGSLPRLKLLRTLRFPTPSLWMWVASCLTSNLKLTNSHPCSPAGTHSQNTHENLAALTSNRGLNRSVFFPRYLISDENESRPSRQTQFAFSCLTNYFIPVF